MCCCTLARLIYTAFVPSGRLLGKLYSPIAIGPTPDRARLCDADELPISLDLVELDKEKTLSGKFWIKFRLSVGRIPMLVRRCGIPGGVESVVVVNLRDCSMKGR